MIKVQTSGQGKKVQSLKSKKTSLKDLAVRESHKVKGGLLGCPCDGGEITKRRR